jgi:hypothetical protein
VRATSYLSRGSRGKTLAVTKEEKKRAAMNLIAIIVERSGMGMTWRVGAHEPNAFIEFPMCCTRISDRQMSWFPHGKGLGIGVTMIGKSASGLGWLSLSEPN